MFWAGLKIWIKRSAHVEPDAAFHHKDLIPDVKREKVAAWWFGAALLPQDSLLVSDEPLLYQQIVQENVRVSVHKLKLNCG